MNRPGPVLAALPLLAMIAAAPAAAAEPLRIDDAWATPDWLSLSGSYRLRYEWLDNTFRAVDPGTDDLIVSRLRFKAEARMQNGLRFGAELQDSRAWGAGTGTPLGTDDVNAFEPLQAYAGYRVANAFRPGDQFDLLIGRFTFGLGSNRLVGEHVFRNTRGAFTGVKFDWSPANAPRLQAFVTRPVAREPSRRGALEDNEIELDEDANTVFWGVHVDRLRAGDLDAELYLYGIDDGDTAQRPTRNRNFLTLGGRLLGRAGVYSWSAEAALQSGSVRETALPADRTELDHEAWLIQTRIGRSFDSSWSPRLSLRLDAISGDRRPGDGDNERFDSLFGPARFDFGHTGIYGALRRENLYSAGVYADFTPFADSAWMIGYRAAWLASRRDSFGASGLRDPAGDSGRFAAHQVETRFRWELAPGNLRFEAGGAMLFKGEFLTDAPGAPPPSDTIYLYTNLLVTF